MRRCLCVLGLIVGSALTGCATRDPGAFYTGVRMERTEPLPSFQIVHQQTLQGIGAGQGVALHNGFIYVFGDADTGVIREYALDRDGATPALVATGRAILCTRDGVDLLPHPTGLTFHPDYPALMGDTVRQVGTLFWIDFDRALEDGTLDHAVIARVDDDLATDGCRPEFMVHDGRLVIATSDHNGSPNRLRLYDPEALLNAARTSDDGVLIASWSCTPFVQSIRWMGEAGACVLVQNQIRGLRYRLGFSELIDGDAALRERRVDLEAPTDELEGFVMLDDELALFVSAMRENNATLARVVR